MMPEHLTHFRAAIFDLDGVVTDTAGLRYRVAKQPDLLMQCYLLSAEDLRETHRRLEYRLDKAGVRKIVD